MDKEKMKISFEDLISEFLEESDFERFISGKNRDFISDSGLASTENDSFSSNALSKMNNQDKDRIFEKVLSKVMLEKFNKIKELRYISESERQKYDSLFELENDSYYKKILKNALEISERRGNHSTAISMLTISTITALITWFIFKSEFVILPIICMIYAFLSFFDEKESPSYVKRNVMLNYLENKEIKYRNFNKLTFLLIKYEKQSESKEEFKKRLYDLLSNDGILHEQRFKSLQELSSSLVDK